MTNCTLTNLNMVDGVLADGADEMFDLAVLQRQAITFLGDQAHDVQFTTVFVAKLEFGARFKTD